MYVISEPGTNSTSSAQTRVNQSLEILRTAFAIASANRRIAFKSAPDIWGIFGGLNTPNTVEPDTTSAAAGTTMIVKVAAAPAASDRIDWCPVPPEQDFPAILHQIIYPQFEVLFSSVFHRGNWRCHLHHRSVARFPHQCGDFIHRCPVVRDGVMDNKFVSDPKSRKTLQIRYVLPPGVKPHHAPFG